MSQWYYAHDGKQSGPVPISELQRLAANGEFDPEKDLVWQEGLPDWKPASAIPELGSLDPNQAVVPEAASPPSAAETTPYQPPQSQPAQAAPNKSYTPTGQLKSGLAVASMVCGLVAFLTCFVWCLSIPLAIAAIITGHMASSRITRDPAQFAGKGFARAGLITGYLGLLLCLLYTAAIMYVATRTPEQMEQIDWLPQQFKEQFQEAFDKQQERLNER